MIFQRDTLGNVICNIRIPLGAQEEIGTAIFIAKNNEPFLLTASHVVKNMNALAYVILSDTNGVPTKVLLTELLGGSSFIDHPTADLAKAKINVTAINTPFLSGRCFPYEQIDITNNPISKDIELTTIGFPLGLGAVGAKFSPLTYRTYVASPVITLPRFDNHVPSDFIILELPSIGGYSGGPTFDLGYVISGGMTTTKENTILHGIVHGTIQDQTGGKLAAITPCKYLNGWL
jgi:S1-C subfamily serine protease